MKTIDKSILTKLNKPNPDSHKGENGRVLVIAGSKKYHGALLMTIKTASRIVDMVYVHSVAENLELIKDLKSKISTYIGVSKKELWDTIELVDTIIIGPGLEENRFNKKFTDKILKKYPEKKIVVDATALWYVNPKLLHKNSVVAPHSREFEHVFKCDPNSDNVLKMAKCHNCLIALTGKEDYISDGENLWVNKTGNVGMTKGGTGDVLVGIIGGLLATNDTLTSILAGVYLNGFVGDKLKKKKGTFYNAEDLIEELGDIWKKN